MLQRLETRVPPPVLLVLLGVIAAGTAALLPGIALPLPGRMLMAGTCVLGGIALNVLPKLTFASAGTTINPLAPQRATQLVTTGLHRYTRNPMYLGHALLLSGWIVSLQQDAALVLVGAYVLAITRLQVLPEERALAAQFGPAYAAYCRVTPRWL